MASIREIRGRVVATKKTQKITSAMKMISAARLARAQQAAESSRAFGAKLTEIFSSLLAGLEPDVHPLLTARAKKKNLDIVLFTSDRGLCGAYNSNLIKQAMAVIAERINEFERIQVIAVGKRGRDFFRRRKVEVPRAWLGLSTPNPDHAHEIGAYLIERYLSGESDETVFVTSRFVSALTQTPTVITALPISGAVSAAEGPPKLAYEIEPDAEALLAQLLPSVVDFMVLRALFEQAASEHGARMTAMDSATENTRELIRSLTLDMNKARQAQITTELTEIVAGAEAL